jgi:hypothetical protein
MLTIQACGLTTMQGLLWLLLLSELMASVNSYFSVIQVLICFFMNQNLILTLLSRSLLLNSIIRKIALKLLILLQMHTYMWKISHPNNISMQARIFHFGSISLIEEPCRSTHLAAMAIARKSGCILSYDPNLRLPLWPSAEAARKGIMSIWDQADIIKV